MKKEKNKGGRPPKFKTVKELQNKFDDFSIKCDETRQLPEKAGLCLFLGISRDTYSEYRKKRKFSDTIKAIDLYIESNWVRRLGGNSPTGAIFYLKNAFKEEYKDRHETDITSKGEKIEGINYIVPSTPNENNNRTDI